MVSLDRCNTCKSCNTLHEPSGRICVPNKEDVNLNVFNTIARINK